jgi:putative ABC transport system permease protein
MSIREIRRNTMRSILTTLGIVIGVASVTMMVTLGRGATTRITNDIANMGTNLLILMPGAEQRGPTRAPALALKLDDVKAIERDVTAVNLVAPNASKTELVVYGDKNWSTTITGATNTYFDVRRFKLAAGARFSDTHLASGAAVCILGDTVRRNLFGGQEAVGATVRMGSVSFDVIGTLEPKGQSTFGTDQDDLAVVPLAAFHRRIAGNKDVGAIFLTAQNDRETSRAKAQVQSLMRERRRIPVGGDDDFQVQDMRELSNTLENVTAALTALLGAIAGVSLLVGGIGIMNIMLVSVTERTREIGVRLAIGARAREVLMQFLVEAIALSTLGGVLGAVFGLGTSYAAAIALKLPFQVMADILALAFGFSTTVGVAFGYLPARKAARLRPIEALRHE